MLGGIDMDSLFAKIGAGVIIIALIVGGKYYVRTNRRADASKEVLVACQAMIQEVPGYKQDPGYMDWLVKVGIRRCSTIRTASTSAAVAAPARTPWTSIITLTICSRG
jgi:hypothetical protein